MRLAITSPLFLAVFLLGCPNPDDSDTDTKEYVPPCELDTNIPCECENDVDEDEFCADDPTDPSYDCDDNNAAVHPFQDEECNGIDDNCVNGVDEGLPDADGDGICDGMDEETCDGVDNDGDGLVDEDFADANNNGIADCVDTEVCDGFDDDGNGTIDDGYDFDGDGVTQCGADGIYGTADDDCDDKDATAYPGATEIDSTFVDEDCDGLIDEAGWGPGDLIITEIMSNPSAVSDPDGEWFEVLNASSRTVVLNGLIISDSGGDYHMVRSDDVLTLDPSDYYVFGANDDTSENGGVTVGYRYNTDGSQNVTLSNETDDLVVKINDEGTTTVIDTVAWDDGATFPDPNGSSMTLEPGYIDPTLNDDGYYWCAAPNEWAPLSDEGTPGSLNDPCTSFDHDGDGYSADDGDCDDTDEDIYPGAPETEAGVDNDCDGVAEIGPDASAELGEGSGDEQCDIVYLDASESTDPDGGTPLTYQWELTSAPTSSALTTADIMDSTTDWASFYPDAAGSYTFTLTVWDNGGAASEPDTLSVTISARADNETPVADAGETQTATGYADCQSVDYGSDYDCDACDDYDFTLDGTGSYDDDGDFITYSWAVTSGSGVLDDATSETPTLTVAGPTPTTPSSSVYNAVFVSLEVTDCMGATSASDTVAVSYTCYGDT